MDRLFLFGKILDLCELGQDYGEPWFELFNENLADSTRQLTFNEVINRADSLGFRTQAQNLNDDTGVMEIQNFVNHYAIDTNRNFFDVVREITNNGGLFRFEEPRAFENFSVGRTTAIAYVPRG